MTIVPLEQHPAMEAPKIGIATLMNKAIILTTNIKKGIVILTDNKLTWRWRNSPMNQSYFLTMSQWDRCSGQPIMMIKNQ